MDGRNGMVRWISKRDKKREGHFGSRPAEPSTTSFRPGPFGPPSLVIMGRGELQDIISSYIYLFYTLILESKIFL